MFRTEVNWRFHACLKWVRLRLYVPLQRHRGGPVEPGWEQRQAAGDRPDQKEAGERHTGPDKVSTICAGAGLDQWWAEVRQGRPPRWPAWWRRSMGRKGEGPLERASPFPLLEWTRKKWISVSQIASRSLNFSSVLSLKNQNWKLRRKKESYKNAW